MDPTPRTPASTWRSTSAGFPSETRRSSATPTAPRLRVQVVYARASDTPDRYADFADSIRQWAGEVDGHGARRAAETGGERHVRFVHDADCVLDVANVVMDPGADDSFDATIADLESRGLAARRASTWCSSTRTCTAASPRSPMTTRTRRLNRNNKGPDYARVDAGCWSGTVAAHELMHTLGAVQLSAPASNRHFGCTASTHDLPIDCDLSNYFDTDPPQGSYLTTHWNVATSAFLVRSRQTLWGYVAAELATNAGYTPEPATPAQLHERDEHGPANGDRRLHGHLRQPRRHGRDGQRDRDELSTA